ncbi:MAG: hypothetical protein GXO80_10325 [Chlorobi bacterium]|nr:hypothetical protein [Chlorobiota bacterium]
MYGSGMEGITASVVTNLKCNNSIIKSCTYSIMTLDNCNGFEFNNCKFTDNQEFDLVNITNCIGVKFNNSEFSNNQTGTDEYSDYSLFNVSKSMSVELKDCTIENNSTVYFANSSNSITITNTKIENNAFEKGNFKQ